MSWTLYTQITAKARALEMVIAVFVAFWAFTVLTYALVGTAPLSWANFSRHQEITLTGMLLALGGLHLIGTLSTDRGAWPGIARAVAMGGMALSFAGLAIQGGGTSAAPTYLGITLACLAAVVPAMRDAHYARRFHAAD